MTSSACSRSAPTGRPLASRVTADAAAQQLGDVQCGRLPGRRRIGREDDLARPRRPRPAQQLGDLQVLGVDAVDRREGAAEHVVEAAVLVGALDRDHVGGSSTTQIVDRSRLGSAQIRQSGPSARLKHPSQRPTFSFTSRIAVASAAASSSGARRMWKASRCAVRWPIPGRRESSATSRASGAGPSAASHPRGGRPGPP